MTSKRKTRKNETVKGEPEEGEADIVIKELGKSTLVEADFQRMEGELEVKEPEHLKGDMRPKLFYRKFVFRCGKCIKEFEHETTIPVIEHRVVCPQCDEDYVVRVIPVARHYEFRLPPELRVMEAKREKK